MKRCICLYLNIWAKKNMVFAAGRSVDTYLSMLLNCVTFNINSKTQTDVIYTDFKKAFVSVTS